MGPWLAGNPGGKTFSAENRSHLKVIQEVEMAVALRFPMETEDCCCVKHNGYSTAI
jgi:hypothetical protein